MGKATVVMGAGMWYNNNILTKGVGVMLKKWMSLLLVFCLLAGAAMAESAVPEVAVPLDEKMLLENEQSVDGYGWMREYSRETSRVYVMMMHAAVTADEMIGALDTSNLNVTVLIEEEGGVKERKVYDSETDNMAVDVAVVEYDGYSVVLMLMSERTTYMAGGQSALMDGWLQGMTINGENVVADIAGAVSATAEKMQQTESEIAEQVESGELIRIPNVGISFGGEGVLTNEAGAENAYMQMYQVGEHTVYVMEYLGEYLCDGVWQSIAFELPENQLLTENENGIRQRKNYAYGNHTGDVTVVWHNGCTIALVVAAPNEAYQAGMQDAITGWLESMTIDGVNVITPAE